MSSAVDDTKPDSGGATTESVRDNFTAIKDEVGEIHQMTIDAATATGTADAITATYSVAPTLVENYRLAIRATATNTGPVTFNPNSLGADTVVKDNREALVAGDIVENAIVEFMYDATNSEWRCLNPSRSNSKQSPFDTHDAAYSFVLTDAGRTMYHSSATAHAWTIEPDTTTDFPDGVMILLSNEGSGVVTLTRGTGVELLLMLGTGAPADQNISLPEGGRAVIHKRTTDKWQAWGTNLS